MMLAAMKPAAYGIEIDGYGGPDVLVWREVHRVPPRGDEILIRTLYAAVNRADVEIRRGAWPIVAAAPFPYTPGLEVAGVVHAVGHDVTAIATGDRVITMMQRLGGIWGERPGGYGEYLVVPAAAAAAFPPDVDAEHLAGLGLVAVTAAEGLARLAIEPGARVVVHGASGGAGSAAGRMPVPAIERFALADVARAHERMERGELRGRALLVSGSAEG